MVLITGLTAILWPVAPPGIQVYDIPPPAKSVLELPAHMAVGVATAKTIGAGFTDTVTAVIVLAHPNAFVPITL